MWYHGVVQYVVAALPLLLLAGIVVLVVRPHVRGRFAGTPRVRAPRRKKSTLRSVPRDRMDDELRDLIRKP
ncbi:MAG: hypothetical protein NVS3B7_14850 [Candidatus Elarobacter sp.]